MARADDAVSFDLDRTRAQAHAQRRLWVELGAIPASCRGGFDDFALRAIETRLREVGALQRSGGVGAALEEILVDQGYRAHLIGFDGLSLGLTSLDELAVEGVLSSDETRALRRWFRAARGGLVRLALPVAARSLEGYTRRESLSAWLEREHLVEPGSSAPGAVLEGDGTGSMDGGPTADPEEPLDAPPEAEPPARALGKELPELSPVSPAPADDGLITRHSAPRTREHDPRQIPLFVDEGGEPGVAASALSQEVTLAQRFGEWCQVLGEADGVTTWEALETAFVTAYSPLEAALAGDTEHHLAQREVLAGWGRRFESCYQQAFERLRHSRQRPTMVFDAPRVAFNLSRANQASGFQLVLIDAFRFDVGQRVFDKLRLQLSGQAECVSRGLLWSPLPANTPTSLELLARGADGLRAPRTELKEAQVVSIKEARRLRKLRAGPHSLYKLDAVQAHLEPGRSWSRDGLEQLAAEVSVSCGRFIKQQSEGTLVFLFGDHGFRLEDSGHGGASPSEVLVPYQAWHVLDRARPVAAE